MATTSLNVVIPPKKTGPSQALRDLSIANSPKKTAPKDQYINNVVANAATVPDRTRMASQLDTAKNQLLDMKRIVDARVEAEQKAKEAQSGPSNALREMSSALSPRPTTPDFYGKANSAMDAYIKSLMPTDQENDLAKQLSNMRSSVSSGIQQASEQAIPMGFITGQQQAIENRGLNAIQPFQDELDRLFAQREAKSKGLSARSEYETALAGTRAEDARYQDEVARDERRYAYDVAKEASAPIEFGGSLYQRNPDGGFTEILSAPPATPEPFELSEGQSRYEFNPETGQYEMVANMPKTYKPESGGGGTSGGIGGSSDRTMQVIDGFIGFEDLTLAERQKVQDQLYELGFASDSVPEWFNDYYVSEGLDQPSLQDMITAGARGEEIGGKKSVQQAWNLYRNQVMQKANTKTKSTSTDDDLSFDSI